MDMTAFEEKLRIIRKSFMKDVTLVTLILVIVGLPISLSRIPYTGFHIAHIVQIILSAAVLAVYIFRKHLSIQILTIFSIIIYTFLSVTGFLQYGLVGGGIYFMMGALLLISVVYGVKIGIISGVIFLSCAAFIALLWITKILTFPSDPNYYIYQPSSWATSLIASIITSALFLIPTSKYLQSISQLAVTVEKQNRTIEKLANHDAITNLPTMRLVSDRLEVALANANRNNGQLAVLFLDLDGFKSVNDQYGHAIGDAVLKVVGERLSQAIRKGDTVGRVGGDEFIIIVSSNDSIENTLSVVTSRILRLVSDEIVTEIGAISNTISIGAAIYPQHGENLFTLRKHADEAMYQVKKSGKNSYLLYNSLKSGGV